MTVQAAIDPKDPQNLCIQFSGKLNPNYTADAYLRCLKGFSDNFHTFTFDFSNCNRAFPNSLLPIICDYKVLKRGGLNCQFIPPKDEALMKIFELTGTLHQFDSDSYAPPTSASDRHLAIVHVGSAEAQHKLVSETIDLLLRSTPLNESIIDGFRWAFNEITGNIFDHSGSLIGGFVQLDIHKKSNRLALCVCDPGIGVLRSIKSAGLHQDIVNDLEAVEHAIRRGFTSDPERNQGNGLAGSLALAKAFKGRFAMRSGKGLLVWEHERDLHQRSDCESMAGTLVDMQLNIDIEISNLGEVITGDPTSEYEPYSVIEDEYLDLASDQLTIMMCDETFGFGSRQAGVQMYTKCQNILRNSTKRLVIDWADVPLIASSFADEFIGKLYADIGPLDFPSRVQLRGMDRTTKHILNSAISQRMSERYRRR